MFKKPENAVMIRTFLLLLLMPFLAIGQLMAQESDYTIVSKRDTTVKTRIGGVTLSSREVRHYVYEYQSKDADGKPATISGVIMIPSDIVAGSTPCDGIMLYNRATLSSPDLCPSKGESELLNGLIANPLRPNYILVMSDFIGYGSSEQYPMFYHSGDVNARNSLDGLLAARKLLTDESIPQGKFLFNMGFSQGGSESLYVAKLRDMEYKDKGVTFTKTFAGGGPTDYVKAYEEYVKKDDCLDRKDVILMLISAVENLHLNVRYSDLFKEPLASKVPEIVKKKDKDLLSEAGVSMEGKLSDLIQPAYMNLQSNEAKSFMAALKKINLMEGWNIDLTQKYFIEHSRHDNYVPIQCVRALIPWMREKGFTPSLVPGKTNLQTNTLVIKADHTISAAVWLIQTMAAIQFWPVVYYEGEQNRYYHGAVKDLNLMKVIKTLESLGIDLRKVGANAPRFKAEVAAAVADGSIQLEGSAAQLLTSKRAGLLDLLAILGEVEEFLQRIDLSISDAVEMILDAGITVEDIVAVVNYFDGSKAPKRSSEALSAEIGTHAPLYLLQLYEQTLASWLLLGGIDVEYSQWGWQTNGK